MASFEYLVARPGGTPPGVTHDWVPVRRGGRISALSRPLNPVPAPVDLVYGTWPDTWEVAVPEGQPQPAGWSVAPFGGWDEQGQPCVVYMHVPADQVRAYIAEEGPVSRSC